MFDDLDATLKAVLDDPAAPAELRAADASFDTPDKDFKPAQPTVNLFLHEVMENRTLRDEARVVTRTSSGYSSRLPSLRVDCTYLTTAWSAKAAGLRAAEEHRLLGLALVWFSRFPVLDDRFLRGSLKVPTQPYPLPTLVAQTREGRSNSEFWTALGVPPRPAFTISVTITVDPYDQVEEVQPLQKMHLRTTLIGYPELRGVVLDHTLSPVSAVVTVIETGATATSSTNGEFTIQGLDFGDYTLSVKAGSQPVEQRAIQYAADHQTKTVVLSGP